LDTAEIDALVMMGLLDPSRRRHPEAICGATRGMLDWAFSDRKFVERVVHTLSPIGS
jgi:hypothetical protein